MAPVTRAMRARAAASLDRIPRDALFDVLATFPARDLCRLRGVDLRWRSLTHDPVFIRAHAAQHPGPPLLLAKFRDDWTHVYVLDLAAGGGAVLIKRLAGVDGGLHVLSASVDLACLGTDWNRCRVLSPATGALQVLPQAPAPEHKNRVNLSDPYTFFALGLINSTGEYKVFRMFNRLAFHLGGEQLFEVLTITTSSSTSTTGHCSSGWRTKPKPADNVFIQASTGVVVGTAVYFLISRSYQHPLVIPDAGTRSDYIISFDLEREEWRTGLRGSVDDDIDSEHDLYRNRYQIALAELRGSLALVYKHRQEAMFVMHLWFLVDFENGVWEKPCETDIGFG